MQPVMAGIKARYGLTAIDVFERGGSWWVTASINPKLERNMDVRSTKKSGTGSAASTLKPMKAVPIDFMCNTNKYVLSVFKKQLKGQADGLNAISVADWEANRATYVTSGRGSNVPQEEVRDAYAKDMKAQGKTKKEIELTLARLAALHEPDLVAGGFNVISKLGSRYINSSIGSQWKDKVKVLETAVNSLSKTDRAKKRINVVLKAVKGD